MVKQLKKIFVIKCDHQKHLARFLEMIGDSKFDRHEQINFINKKIRVHSSLYVINNVKIFLTPMFLKTIYFSLINPDISYGLALCDGIHVPHTKITDSIK